VVVLALVEVAWLAWALNVPLVNANSSAGPGDPKIARSFFLWRFFPAVIPGLKWHDSFLGGAVDDLSHVGNLPQRLPIVLAAGLIVGAGVALGALILRALGLRSRWSRLERLGVGFGLGMTGLGLFALLMGRAGWLTPWTAKIGLVVPLLASAALLMRDRVKGATGSDFGTREEARTGSGTNPWHPAVVGWLLLVVPFLVVMALGSMLPTIDFDAIEYHLEGPKEYFLAGKIQFLPYNVYTCMPFGVEMLHLLGMHVVGDWWWGALAGQLVVASFAPMAGLMVGLTAWRWGSPRAGWVAAVVYLTTPWIYRLAAIPYVEGPLCFYHATLAWTAGMAWTEQRGREWLVVGLLAGGAMAIKYPALISAVLPFGVVALVASWKAKSTRPTLAFSLGVLLVMAPWLLKNVVDTGNPVYPLGYRVFGGRDWDAEREAKWTNAHGPKPVEWDAFKASSLEVAARSDWQSPALFALAPLAFLRRESRRIAFAIGGYVIYLFLTWWFLTHRLDRFWLPLLPGLAVLAGLGADWTRGRGWTALVALVLTVSIASSVAQISTDAVGFHKWTGDLEALRRDVPRMVTRGPHWADIETPPGAVVLMVGQAQAFHMNHRVVYNTVFDRDIFESIDRGRSPEEVRAELNRRGITHVYVDWSEIARYRSPGNYGFTDYVTPDRFARLVAAGVLSRARPMGHDELYTVLPPR
jgi:hypothetical protein